MTAIFHILRFSTFILRWSYDLQSLSFKNWLINSRCEAKYFFAFSLPTASIIMLSKLLWCNVYVQLAWFFSVLRFSEWFSACSKNSFNLYVPRPVYSKNPPVSQCLKRQTSFFFRFIRNPFFHFDTAPHSQHKRSIHFTPLLCRHNISYSSRSRAFSLNYFTYYLIVSTVVILLPRYSLKFSNE